MSLSGSDSDRESVSRGLTKRADRNRSQQLITQSRAMLKELDQMESQNHMRRVQILCHEVTATHTQIPAQPSTRAHSGFSPGMKEEDGGKVNEGFSKGASSPT